MADLPEDFDDAFCNHPSMPVNTVTSEPLISCRAARGTIYTAGACGSNAKLFTPSTGATA